MNNIQYNRKLTKEVEIKVEIKIRGFDPPPPPLKKCFLTLKNLKNEHK